MGVNPITAAFPFQGYSTFEDFDPEVMTLKYLADLATRIRARRVPQVLHYFYQQGGMTYVVTELIQLDASSGPRARVPPAI